MSSIVDYVTYPIPTDRRPLEYAPVESITECCGLYFRSIVLQCPGDLVPQHKHDHDHATLVASGQARCWSNGVYIGDYSAGEAVTIYAGVEHLFQALQPMTRLVCVHDIESA